MHVFLAAFAAYIVYAVLGGSSYERIIFYRTDCHSAGSRMYSLNLPGTCLALLFPNWNPLPPWNAFTILAFSMHGLLLLVPICMLASRDLQPSAKRLPACLLSLLLACIPISLVNRQLGTNFFFLARPSRNSPLSWAAQYLGNPGYLLIIPGLIALIWGILYGVPAGVHAVARKVRRK